MRSIAFEGDTWEVYEKLRRDHPKLHRNLCRLLKEMRRGNPATGTGKPEPLRHQLRGLWSRRISQRDRVVYRFDERCIYILAIGGHYEGM